MPGPLQVTPRLTVPETELSWRFSRSSGPGGQSVNTSDSRAELSFDVARSPSLPVPLLIVLLLGVVTVLLIRNMSGRIKRLPPSFPDQEPADQPPSAPEGRPPGQRAPEDEPPAR